MRICGHCYVEKRGAYAVHRQVNWWTFHAGVLRQVLYHAHVSERIVLAQAYPKDWSPV